MFIYLSVLAITYSVSTRQCLSNIQVAVPDTEELDLVDAVLDDIMHSGRGIHHCWHFPASFSPLVDNYVMIDSFRM